MGLSLGKLKVMTAGFWLAVPYLDLGWPICKNPFIHSLTKCVSGPRPARAVASNWLHIGISWGV